MLRVQANVQKTRSEKLKLYKYLSAIITWLEWIIHCLVCVCVSVSGCWQLVICFYLFSLSSCLCVKLIVSPCLPLHCPHVQVVSAITVRWWDIAKREDHHSSCFVVEKSLKKSSCDSFQSNLCWDMREKNKGENKGKERKRHRKAFP